jgi:hypothetical protein
MTEIVHKIVAERDRSTGLISRVVEIHAGSQHDLNATLATVRQHDREREQQRLDLELEQAAAMERQIGRIRERTEARAAVVVLRMPPWLPNESAEVYLTKISEAHLLRGNENALWELPERITEERRK